MYLEDPMKSICISRVVHDSVQSTVSLLNNSGILFHYTSVLLPCY